MENKTCPFCGAVCWGNKFHVVYACGSINHLKASAFDQTGWVRSSKCYETQIAALQAVLGKTVEVVRAAETFECPMAGRAFCLGKHIAEPLIAELEGLLKMAGEG